jgi:tetratricopeptide (TPR) repeat protein
MYAALMRQDGQTALASATRLPDLQFFSPLQFARGRAHLLVNDYTSSEQELRQTLTWERNLSNFNVMRQRSPLLAILAHFYLAQVYEATQKRDQAVNEYQEFLSHFEDSHAPLAEVKEAHAALKRLMP